ncbi:amidohydrolase family protein [Aquimarina gracilis]|uniref:Amidohydrolase family protein n=1 Tax=Aquimarina gracilis TaxID=874422 RepID=A0ABU5ZX50_9FLAO|nr:amidohydrolase family protein [Aquimarina gracilis]MEB3346441.1 amidohydrolase family protein [Aquimarina gracilis]
MKRTSIKKWILGIVLVLITGIVISYIYVTSQIKHHTGSKTEVVDSSIFNVSQSPLAITNVNVLSSDFTEMKDSLTIFIKEDKIISISKDTIVTNEYSIIDGTGKYLIPGLIDAHAHLHRSKNDLLLYLANGITSIANMSSQGDNLYLKWREEARNGSLSPKIYVAAGGMSTRKDFRAKINTIFGSRYYNTPKAARKAVKKFKEQGYDAIKSYAPSKEVYYAIIDEAQKQDIPVTGHLPFDVGLEGLYTSGQSGLAHVEEITKNTFEDFGGMSSIFYDNVESYFTYLQEQANTIATNLKKNHITVCSTSNYYELILEQDLDLKAFLKKIEIEYANPGIIEGSRYARGWFPGSNQFENPDNENKEGRKKAKIFWGAYAKAVFIMTKTLIDHEVHVVTGSDSNGSGTVPGFSFLDQLESLHRIGLDNSQILKIATKNASDWMQHNTGAIEIGLAADLVLLNKNPLENISNTKTIEAVITNGKLLDRNTLDQMLLAVKKANNRSRKMSIDEYVK